MKGIQVLMLIALFAISTCTKGFITEMYNKIFEKEKESIFMPEYRNERNDIINKKREFNIEECLITFNYAQTIPQITMLLTASQI